MSGDNSPSVLLIDLDGTLIDPAPGIVGSCRHALQAMGRVAPAPAELHWIIGPPLRQSFAILLGPQGDPEEALRHYRALYSVDGLFDAAVYDGVTEALALLRGGRRLFLCTSKPVVFARRILDHFGLAAYFEGVYGAELDGRFEDKGDLIAHLMETEGVASEDACMIGDRRHDIEAAHRHGMAAIGALWGYGGEAELRAAGADVLCARPADLAAAVAAIGPRGGTHLIGAHQ